MFILPVNGDPSLLGSGKVKKIVPTTNDNEGGIPENYRRFNDHSYTEKRKSDHKT